MLSYRSDGSGNVTRRGPEAPAPPRIVAQPVDRLTAAGDFASFAVVVGNAGGATFQWSHDGAPILDATGDSLLLTGVGPADVGQYAVTVTNGAGSVTSDAAALVLLGTGETPTSARPRLLVAGAPDGSVSVNPAQRSYAPPGAPSFPEPVSLTAMPTAGSVFVGWSGDVPAGVDATAATVSVPMDRSRTLRARFASPVALPPDLVALWQGATDATDFLGRHHGAFMSGTTAVGPATTASGRVGRAFELDGTVHVVVPDAEDLRPDQLTLEAWVFPSARTVAPQTVIARGSTIDHTDTWSLDLRDGQPHFEPGGLDAPLVVPANAWTHLAGTFDGTTSVLYVNGTEVARATRDLGAPRYDPAPVPVTIGSNWSANASAGRFTGRLDEVALYRRALLALEIAQMHHAGAAGKDLRSPYFTSAPRWSDVAVGTAVSQRVTSLLGAPPVSFSVLDGVLPPGVTLSPDGTVAGSAGAAGAFACTLGAQDADGRRTEQRCRLRVLEPVVAPAGLVSWWRAEGDADDATGANHGQLRSGAGFAPGRVGQAFAFDGTDDCVEVADAASLRPASLTLEAWVRFDATMARQAVFAKSVGFTISDSYALWLNAGHLNGAIGDAGDMGPVLTTPTPLAPGRWYHVAYTFDDGSNQQTLHLDGRLVDAGVMNKSIGYDAQPLALGRGMQRGTPNYFLKGRIDEAAVYNRALSEAEIASLHAAGPAGKRL